MREKWKGISVATFPCDIRSFTLAAWLVCCINMEPPHFTPQTKTSYDRMGDFKEIYPTNIYLCIYINIRVVALQNFLYILYNVRKFVFMLKHCTVLNPVCRWIIHSSVTELWSKSGSLFSDLYRIRRYIGYEVVTFNSPLQSAFT